MGLSPSCPCFSTTPRADILLPAPDLVKTRPPAKLVGVTVALLLSLGLLVAVQAPPDDPLQPYAGPSVKGVDVETLTGKVMVGYQGWFSAEGDGSGRGWGHWTKNRSKPFDAANTKV